MDYLQVLCVLAVALLGAGRLVRGQMDAPLEYRVEEENPRNTFVANITKDAGLYHTLTRAQLERLRYSFTAGLGIYRQYFAVNSQTGVLTTIKSIDREEVCQSDAKCTFNMAVMIQPYEFFQIIKIVVQITDINDHYPRFPTDKKIMTISEGAATGRVFPIPIAEDPDSGIFGVQQYRLETDSAEFKLQVTDAVDGSKDLDLVLTGSLDKEQLDWYDLLITAVDGGTPPKTGSMLLEITVLDANDNNPKFDNDTYTVTISENTPLQSTVVKIQATDMDSGPNGQIVYSFSSATEQAFGNIFDLNSQTGDILVRGPIDYEEASEFQLSVLALDRGPDSLPAHAKVIVHVKDMNDHAPEISINTLTDTGLPEVLESSPVGTFVAHISAKDPDSGPSGEVACSITDTFFTLEQLYSSEYTLKTATVFDRELRAEYALDIECSDSGPSSMTTKETIIIKVLDLNDHDPIFWDTPYATNIRENNVVGMYLLQVNATDRDYGRNSAIKFKVIDPLEENSDSIAINPISGVITANSVFDYERDQTREFVVIGYDQGVPSRSVSATFTVTIEDTNDEAPQFFQDSYEFLVYENQPAGTEVGIVVALDADSPPYNKVTYSLEGAHSATTVFQIHPETGEISTRRHLDREEQSVFQLYVSADNVGYPNLKTSTNLTVTIVDQNDNSPVIVFPSPDNNTVELTNKMAVGSLVSHVVALDLDEGRNALLTYQFEMENDTFVLNETTGEIHLVKPLGGAVDQMYHFDIVVRDQGSPQQQTLMGLLIFVNRQRAIAGSTSQSVIGFLKSNLFLIIIGTVVILLVIFLILVAVVCTTRRRAGKDSKAAVQKVDMVAADSMEKIPMDSMNCSPARTPSPRGPPGLGGSPVQMTPAEMEERQKKGVTFQMDNTESCTEDPPPWQDRLDATVIENPRALSRVPPGGSHEEVDIVKYPRPHLTKLSLGPDPAAWGRHQSGQGVYSHPDAPRLQLQAPPPRPPPRSSPITPLTEMELEVHEMLRILQQDRDSETGSNTDSGRGPSEEGDHTRHSPLGPGHDDHRGERRNPDSIHPKSILKHDHTRHLASRPANLHPVERYHGSGVNTGVPQQKNPPYSQPYTQDGQYSPGRVDQHVLPPSGRSQSYQEALGGGEVTADLYDKPYHFVPGKGWNSPKGYDRDNYYDPRERRIFHEGCGDTYAKLPKDGKYYSYSPPKGSSPPGVKLPPRYPSDSVHECASPELKAKYGHYGNLPHPLYQNIPHSNQSCRTEKDNVGVSTFKSPRASRNMNFAANQQKSRQNRSDMEKIMEGEGGLRMLPKDDGSKDILCESGISDTSDSFSLEPPESGQYFSGEQMVV